MLALLLLGTPVYAQDAPSVEAITFEGAESFPASALEASIVTKETRCRGAMILQPLCRVADWDVLFDRHYLDDTEIPLDELRLETFYFLRGFREAVVESEIRTVDDGVEIVFRIDEGEPTLLESIQVRQEPELISARNVRRTGLPKEGEPLDLVALDTALAHLASEMGQIGYLDAILHDSVEVSTPTRSARVEIVIEGGAQTTVGEIDIIGNEQVDDQTITDALRLREGRVLRTTDIVASQRSLYESNLFHEARVAIPPQPESAKRLEISVREAPQRGARIGAGFNTIEFFQTEARFTHYNLMGGGRRLEFRATVGNLLARQLNNRGIFRDVLPADSEGRDQSPFLKPTWLASIDLMQPAFRSSPQTLGGSVFSHRRIIPGVVIDEGIGTELSVTRRVDFGAPMTLSYRFESTSVQAGDLYFCVNYGICDIPTVNILQSRHYLSPVRFGFFSDAANDPIAATEGHRVSLDLEHASGFTFSDFRYNRASGDAMVYYPVDDFRRRIVAGRVRAGWVRPLASSGAALGFEDEESLLHPRKRFYSGGSRSVRGFGENQLGPRVLTIDPADLLPPPESEDGEDVPDDRVYCTVEQIVDATCDPSGAPTSAFDPRPLGGTAVFEANLEYRFPVWGGFTGVVFVDGATVGEGLRGLWSGGTAAITPGIGVRMATPIGPVRVDLGLRPRLVEELPVFTEIVNTEGERELIRLNALRSFNTFDSSEESLLRRTLGRFTLHLSVGEAF